MSSKTLMTSLVYPLGKAFLRTAPTSIKTFGSHNHLYISKSFFSTKHLTPSISLFTNGSISTLKSSPDLSPFDNEGRPLAVLIRWLASKPNAVQKYVTFYLDQGFDVLTLKISPLELLLPAKADPIIRHQILPTLHSSPHSQKLIHGFSVGGYVFAQMLKYMQSDPSDPKSQALMASMKAQIWDSVVDVNGISIGVSKSVFMTSPFLQKALQGYIDFHLKIFHDVATKYYEEAHEYYYNKPLKAPALFLASEIDQISTIDVVKDLQNLWATKFGIKCEDKVWDNTQHVGHMRRYPEEYKMRVKMFLDKTGFKRAPATEVVRRGDDERVIPQGAVPNVVYSKSG